MKAQVHRPLEGAERIILTPESGSDQLALECIRDKYNPVWFGNDPKTNRVLYVELPLDRVVEHPNIELISIAEAAKRTHLSEKAIREMISDGTLHEYKPKDYVNSKLRLTELITAVENMRIKK
ncbi:MAG: hypothetical protein AAGG48_14625 [Planctomycetota bacterium]